MRAADVIVVQHGKVLLVKRADKPFKGKWALPGGMVEEESPEQAAVREVREETGIEVAIKSCVGVFSGPGRDPRGPVESTAFSAVVTGGKLKRSQESSDVKWFPVTGLPELAFDHKKIIGRYLDYA